MVDIQWQDGTIVLNVPSIDLIPVNNVLDEDFWPEDFVVEKGEGLHRIGVVRKVNAADRTCIVSWLKYKDAGGQIEEVEEEEVPVFSVVNHPDWTFRLGDIVLRLPGNHQEAPQQIPPNAGAGEIIDIKDGKLRVYWANNTTSWVEPEEVLKIEDDEEDDEEIEYFSEDEWSDEEEIESEEEPSNVLQSIVNTTASYFSQLFHPSQPEQTHPTRQESEQVENQVESQVEETEQEVVHKEDKEEEEEEDATPGQFPSFGVVEDLAGHKFINKELPYSMSKFSSRVLSEWDLLKKNLPGGVYVRVFENRIDLFRFIVVGPPGTPYHNSIFAFDGYLPPNYPKDPPELHFISYGEKLNPNLYKDGRVCLSLLGTWAGKGVENWNPQKSNILQVVLSIQGLILGTPNPYFLEAGFDKLKGTIQGEHAAKLYNESAFLLSLETVPAILASPPKHFEDIIRWHFKECGKEILETCRWYIGEKEPEQNVENKNFVIPTPSVGFVKALVKLLPKLEACLASL